LTRTQCSKKFNFDYVLLELGGDTMGDLCGVDAGKVQTRHTTPVCALIMASAAIDDIYAAFALLMGSNMQATVR
jgi:hypothetical protein